MLSTLLGGGIPLVNALEIAVRSISNRYMSDGLDEVRRRVQEGQSFAGALRAREVFPDVAVKMVEVGESTGALQDMLNSLAEFYDEEIETEVERVTKLIEPVMLVLMGDHHRGGRAGVVPAAVRVDLGRGGIGSTDGNRIPTYCRTRRNTPRRSRARARWPSGIGSSSSTWRSSGSIRTSSGRFPPI